MYKELRGHGSTPEAWEGPFLKSENPLIHALKIHSLTGDMRWKQIAQRIPQGSRVLDAGCGIGEWVMFMRKKGLEPCGMDYSRKMISFLRHKYPEQEWQEGAVQNIPFSSISFDAVISWGVIEHDENGPQKALKEFYRVLKVGGRLFITVPVDSLAQRKSSMIIFNNQANGHFFQYFITPDELKDFICKAGFEVESIRPVSRHYALIFPELYHSLITVSPLLSRLVGLLLKPVLAFVEESLNMVLAVAKKPMGIHNSSGT